MLLTGARYSHAKGVREVYARGLLDTLGPTGRDNFWRFASMVQRRGGETFVEFRTPRSRGEEKFFGKRPRTFVRPGHRGPGDRGARWSRRAPRDRAGPGARSATRTPISVDSS